MALSAFTSVTSMSAPPAGSTRSRCARDYNDARRTGAIRPRADATSFVRVGLTRFGVFRPIFRVTLAVSPPLPPFPARPPLPPRPPSEQWAPLVLGAGPLDPLPPSPPVVPSVLIQREPSVAPSVSTLIFSSVPAVPSPPLVPSLLL